MKEKQIKMVIQVCGATGNFFIEGSEFLEFLPTEEQQLALAKERILVLIDHSFRSVNFKMVVEEKPKPVPVYKDYEVVVSRLASKSVQFTVNACCEGEAGDLAVKAAENYDYNCQTEDTVGYEVEYLEVK
jgi:hypothetical protein